MLPEFQKVQRENDELKVILKDKDAIVQTTKNDLIKLHKKTTKLGLQVNIANQSWSTKTTLTHPSEKIRGNWN